MQNGGEEESDVDSMVNDKWHRIANTDLDEVTVSAAPRHLPDRLVMNCDHLTTAVKGPSGAPSNAFQNGGIQHVTLCPTG